MPMYSDSLPALIVVLLESSVRVAPPPPLAAGVSQVVAPAPLEVSTWPLLPVALGRVKDPLTIELVVSPATCRLAYAKPPASVSTVLVLLLGAVSEVKHMNSLAVPS